ncbi:hypothetical protein VN12_12235 [Pirellula sp. SH-Sr6A]|uniref:hypothetical protein n=1 Tax=Pirellula sp. SH-Sr6A TaxID=1632865 RepID=UPI00078E89ED|nr:hypothetical protein [Pirellula sp. SH-Sr6A]AMV32887.1 hypothetical protein VN12_12235 [Pirellula sp. SH-Sr6A]
MLAHQPHPHRIKLAPSPGWQWESTVEHRAASRSFQGTTGLLEAGSVRLFLHSLPPPCSLELNEEIILVQSGLAPVELNITKWLRSRNRISLRWPQGDEDPSPQLAIPFELWIEIDT